MKQKSDIQYENTILGTECKLYAQLFHMGYDISRMPQNIDIPYRCMYTYQEGYGSDTPLPPHIHEFYETIFCDCNCGVEYFVGTKRYILQRGDIVFIPPNVNHRPIPIKKSEQYRRYVLWIKPDFLEQVAQLCHISRLYPGDVSMLRTTGTTWEKFREYFWICAREMENQYPDWEGVVVGNTVTLLTMIHRAVTTDLAVFLPAEQPDILDRALAYIETHYTEKITLDDVAHNLWVSKSTITHIFHKKIHLSFYRCLTQRRLLAAQRLILHGEHLESISEQVGFSDYTTFYRSFKKEYGISPRQFRQSMGK